MSKYKVGDKFIVEIGKIGTDPYYFDIYYFKGVGGFFYEDEIKEIETCNPTDTAEDAWELMKNIDSDMTLEEKRTVLGHNTMIGILKTNTYALAKEKYRIWKSAQEIRVGDEVECLNVRFPETKFIVTKVKEYGISAISKNGEIAYILKENVKKTGGHFNLTPMFEFLQEGESDD